MASNQLEPIFSTLASNAALSSLVADFVAEMPARIDAMYRFFKAGDWDGLRKLSHQLKGTAGSYGFPALTAIAERLEAAAQSRASQIEIQLQLEQMVAINARLRVGKPQ